MAQPLHFVSRKTATSNLNETENSTPLTRAQPSFLMKTSNSSLLRLRAVFCAVVALLALPSVSRATTTTVTYAGTEYDISFYLGTYDTAPSGVNLSTQPWFGSATVAADFAQLVGGSLGFGNFNSQSPYFVYALGNGGTTWAGAYFDSGGYVTGFPSVPTEGWMGRFAYVTESTPVATPDGGTSLGLGLIAFVALGLARRRLKPAAV